MNSQQKSALWPALITLCSLLLLLSLTGCDTGGAATGTSNTPKLDSSPKGPGGLTATPNLSSNCSLGSTTPVSTHGWPVYKDARFHFEFPIPPGWRAGSFTDDSGNDYIVQIFPPASTTPIGLAGLGDPEHFSISVLLAGPTGTYAGDPNWRVEPGSISISGVKTTLYDRTTPDCTQVNRGATADLGQHHFTFFMVSLPSKQKADSALFESILQSFKYPAIN